MLSAGTAAANQYPQYVDNCQRAVCALPYTAPLPSVADLQLFVDFGASQPGSLEFTLIDTCNNNTDQIFPSEFIVGQTPELNWYGVFRGFNDPIPNTSFVVHLSVDGGSASYFSQMFSTEPCGPLMKIKSCHAEEATTTAFDVNGIYYGMPEGASAGSEISYIHTAYVRHGKVREMNDKATFKSNLYFNARTVVEKTHQIQTEIVSKWYKDVLLAVYSRGMVQINDGQVYLVSDLVFEALNDDDFDWKPWAQVKETFRLFYGCDEFCNIPESESPVESEPAPSGSASEPAPTNNFILQASAGWNITLATGDGTPSPPLPPTGINGSQTGTHTGLTDTVFVTIVGTVVIPVRIEVYIDNVPTFCQTITGSDTYIFPGLSVLPSEDFKVTITLGPPC